MYKKSKDKSQLTSSINTLDIAASPKNILVIGVKALVLSTVIPDIADPTKPDNTKRAVDNPLNCCKN